MEMTGRNAFPSLAQNLSEQDATDTETPFVGSCVASGTNFRQYCDFELDFECFNGESIEVAGIENYKKN